MFKTIWHLMTAICKLLLVFLVLVFNATQPLIAAPEETCKLTEVNTHGLIRTDLNWFYDYLGIAPPQIIPSSTFELEIRLHIMTTDIFSSADVKLRVLADKSCHLEIEVKEKWTSIPVIRGAYGGGTPLTVVGAYETNAFGKLYLLGVEGRRYGSRPPGMFLFAKSPRAWRGLGSFGGELWLDRRRRAFFDEEGKVNGFADSEAWTAKFQLLYPVNFSKESSERNRWQMGLHLEMIRESPAVFLDKELRNSEDQTPQGISIPLAYESSGVLMPMVVYDNISVDKLTLVGKRLMVRAGGQASLDSSKTTYSSAAESEVFHYSQPVSQLNLAFHGFAGTQGRDSLRSLYFLGGFDSVRGLYDGVHYGTKIAYINSEVRFLAAESRYLQSQLAVFFDHGAAFSKNEEFIQNRESAVGLGVRFSVPQVYRLLLRIDYGVSIGATKSRGFSIGLGQFFHPYKLTY